MEYFKPVFQLFRNSVWKGSLLSYQLKQFKIQHSINPLACRKKYFFKKNSCSRHCNFPGLTSINRLELSMGLMTEIEQLHLSPRGQGKEALGTNSCCCSGNVSHLAGLPYPSATSLGIFFLFASQSLLDFTLQTCAPQAALCPSDRTASGEAGGCEGQA